MKLEARRILVAVDGSSASMLAGRWAIEIAEIFKGSVHLVSVLADEGRHRHIGGDDAGTEAARERVRVGLEHAQRYLERLGTNRGVSMERTLVTDSMHPPFEAILSIERSWRADVVFIGRTSRAGPGRALLGSQTEHVLEFSEVPVVGVPAPRKTNPR